MHSNVVNHAAQHMMITKWGQLEYSKYIQRIIELKDTEVLDSFGVYVQGMDNDMISTEMKCFLLLEAIFEDPSSRDSFIMTSSDILVEELEELLVRFRNIGDPQPNDPEVLSVDTLHQELVELMLDYLDGC